MRKDDIRFDGRTVLLKHHSARGRVTRNAGDFTRGSQLITHEVLMTFAGVKIPLLCWFFTFVTLAYAAGLLLMREHETQLVLMRLWAMFWMLMDFEPGKFVNLTLPNGHLQSLPMMAVADHPAVAVAWGKAVRLTVGTAAVAAFIAAPLALWFIDLSRRRGRAILEERHERGAMLVGRDVLVAEIRAHNGAELARECAAISPPMLPGMAGSLPPPASFGHGSCSTRCTHFTACQRSSTDFKPPADSAGRSCWGCTRSISCRRLMASRARLI